MRKRFIFEKILVSLILEIVFLLTFSSQSFSKEIELKLLNLESQDRGTQIEIKTTRPVYYYWFYIDNPPALVVDFFGDEIFGSFDKDITLEEGPIEKIETFYLNEKKRVDFLLFKFRHAPKITAKHINRSLTVRVNDVLLEEGGASQGKQSELKLSLNLAKEKLRQESSKKYPVLGSQESVNVSPAEERALLAEAKVSSAKSHPDSSPAKSFLAGEIPGESLPEGVEKATFGLPISDEKTPDNFISAIKAVSSKKVTSTNFSNSQVLSSSSPVVRQRPYGFLGIFAYLFGSISAVCATALWYKVKQKGEKLPLPYEAKQKQVASEPKESKEKTKFISERRKFPRLEIENLSFKHRPRFKIETLDSARPTHNCQLKNLSLGGVCFKLGPRKQVPLIVQMETIFPEGYSVEACARIVWHKPLSSNRKIYGACFLTLEQTDRENLDTYLTKNLKNNGE